MFDDVLIESSGKDAHKKDTAVTAMISAVVHGGIIAAVIAAGLYVKSKPAEPEKPIPAFITQAAPPSPPPPPPAEPETTQPHGEHVGMPREIPQFHQPTEVPRDVPQVESTQTETTEQEKSVVGGQVDGVVGGVVDS